MNFAFSEEQEELRKAVRRFMDDKSPVAEVRRLMETDEGYDPAVWKQLSEQLGLCGLAIPEEFGGSGFSAVEQSIVFEEMGRALYCGPYYATVALAANALLSSADEAAQSEYLPGIAAGETIATLAVTEEDGDWGLDSFGCSAEATGGGYKLSGSKSYVIDGQNAALFIVAAQAPAGVSLFAVKGGAQGLAVEAMPTLDQTRKMAKVTFAGTPARLLGQEGAGSAILSATMDLASAALAAEEVGGAARCLDMAVDYAKSRIQFGRAIGSFQAIKHKCADILLEVESAKSAAYYAGWVASQDSDELAVAAPLAKAFCSDAYFQAAAENIQIHGGIGFTWEHDAHLYFKRAKSSQLLFGDSAYHRAMLADRVGI